MAAPPLDVWFPEIILVVEGAARSVAGQAPPDAGGSCGRRYRWPAAGSTGGAGAEALRRHRLAAGGRGHGLGG